MKKSVNEEKRKKINSKILKFGCLPILALLAIGWIGSLFTSDETESIENTEVIEPDDPLNLGRENIKAMAGDDIPKGLWDKWGTPEIIGTNKGQWGIQYFDSSNVSIVFNKNTKLVEFADLGQEGAIEYQQTVINQRNDLIEKQFSAWDGSHRKLTDLIKESMNDPKSYEHVKTVYYDRGNHLIIHTTFRGNNAFGGKVLDEIQAKVDLNGNILEITE